MRGDSLRDFYAKVLAVAGLGLVACIGALVDYWPAGDVLPTVAAAPRVPPAATLVQRFDIEIPAPELAPVVRPVAPAPSRAFASLIATHAVPLGAAVPLAEPVAPLPVAPAVAVPAAPIALAVPAASAPPDEPAPSPPATSGLEEGNGFFSGAIRKTRDSIVKTGVVTGSSIVDVFRGVVGMFKKVNPF